MSAGSGARARSRIARFLPRMPIRASTLLQSTDVLGLLNEGYAVDVGADVAVAMGLKEFCACARVMNLSICARASPKSFVGNESVAACRCKCHSTLGSRNWSTSYLRLLGEARGGLCANRVLARDTS
eukprot:1470919-Pleurochrysis_carterae.AAC.1